MILLSSSPGPSGAGNVLAAATGSAPYFAGDVKGSFKMPSFHDNFDTQNNLFINHELHQELSSIVARL